MALEGTIKPDRIKSNKELLAVPGVVEAKSHSEWPLEGTIKWDTRPHQASLLGHQRGRWGPAGITAQIWQANYLQLVQCKQIHLSSVHVWGNHGCVSLICQTCGADLKQVEDDLLWYEHVGVLSIEGVTTSPHYPGWQWGP